MRHISPGKKKFQLSSSRDFSLKSLKKTLEFTLNGNDLGFRFLVQLIVGSNDRHFVYCVFLWFRCTPRCTPLKEFRGFWPRWPALLTNRTLVLSLQVFLKT